MPENMMNSAHKTTNETFRAKYDQICWEYKEKREKEETEQDDCHLSVSKKRHMAS